MYSHLEIQNATTQQLQEYLLQPILHTADLDPIKRRLITLIESFNRSDDNETKQLHFLADKVLKIFSTMDRTKKIKNLASSFQAFKPELQSQSVVNFLNVIPKELIHTIFQELSFYEQLALMPVSKHASKIIKEMPIHDKYIFIKNVYMLSIDQLNPEYDLAILPEQLDIIKPRTIYLSDKNGKLEYAIIPFNKSKLVQNIITPLDVPDIFSIETLLPLKDNILKITEENNHTQKKTKSSWTYKELRKLDVLKNQLNADDTLVVTYADEVQEDTRAKLPWMVRSPVGMTILWYICTMAFTVPMVLLENKTLKYVNSTSNFTKHEQDLLSYAGEGLYLGGTMLSGLLSFICILLLREKYVQNNIHNARNEARQLFGFFKNDSSDEDNFQLAETEEQNDKQCIVSFSSEDEEELFLRDNTGYPYNLEI